MAKVNIRDLKAHLSSCIDRVERGETIIVCKRNEPVAELRPVLRGSKGNVLGRPVPGFHVPESFFDALPADVLESFEQ